MVLWPGEMPANQQNIELITINVNLRPTPTRVNAILGYPCVMVRNGYFIPIFFLLTSGIVFRTLSRLQKKLVWLSCGGGGGVHEGCM